MQFRGQNRYYFPEFAPRIGTYRGFKSPLTWRMLWVAGVPCWIKALGPFLPIFVIFPGVFAQAFSQVALFAMERKGRPPGSYPPNHPNKLTSVLKAHSCQ